MYKKCTEDIRPFEPGKEIHLEAIADANNCGTFIHIKKPSKKGHNITFGRFYERKIFDMLETRVIDYKPIEHFKHGCGFYPDSKVVN